MTWRRLMLAFIVFAVLAVVHTWPLASAPATLGRFDNKDTALNAWAILWVARALVIAPTQVLEGNIFHPEAHTVAFSEPVVIPGVLTIPVYLAGAGPLLAYNLSLLLGYVLSGLAMFWLVWGWTRRMLPALVAGSLFTFNAHSLVSMGHIQAIHAYGLPLLLIGLDGLLRVDGRRLWHGLLAGAATAILALTSGYLTIFGITAALVVIAVRSPDLWQTVGQGRRLRAGAAREHGPFQSLGQGRRQHAGAARERDASQTVGQGSHPHSRAAREHHGGAWRPLLTAGLAGTVLAGLCLYPVLRVYQAVRERHGVVRSLDLVAQMSANGPAYLATPARVHEWWARDVYASQAPRDSLFPGVLAVSLALVGVVAWPGALRDARVQIGLGLALVGLILSFGPVTPIYRAFYATVPFASGVRAASRFGVLWLTGLALLAGLGVAATGRRWPRTALATGLLALVGVNAEAFRGPVPLVATPPISPIYERLAALPDGVVAEMPFWWDPIDVANNADYMIGSTRHWKPLLNGYSGFIPASYRQRADLLWYFPFREACYDELVRAGVRYVVLHLETYGSQRAQALELIQASGRLRQLARDGDAVLYEVVR